MKLRVGICDDEESVIWVLQQYMERYQMQKDIEFEIESFTNGKELLQSNQKNPYHIALLDVEMPEIDGLEVAKKLREDVQDDIIIVFVTSYPKYMQDSFDVQPFQFLVKPIQYEQMEKLFRDIVHRYEHSRITKVIVETDGEKRVIQVRDIVYMKTLKDKKPILQYVLQNETITGEGTIQQWEASLRSYAFISPCRGYLVNLKYVVAVERLGLRLVDGTTIPISRRRVKAVRDLFLEKTIVVMY